MKFQYYIPTRILFGKGQLNALHTQQLPGKKALIVTTGGQSVKKFGYLETYRPEICFEYTMLFYVNTLFSYMVGKGHKSLSFIRKMGNELKEAFPDFADNPYYQERVNAKQKKMIAMQQRSTAAFVLYYKALWTWRNFRKKHFGKK